MYLRQSRKKLTEAALNKREQVELRTRSRSRKVRGNVTHYRKSSSLLPLKKLRFADMILLAKIEEKLSNILERLNKEGKKDGMEKTRNLTKKQNTDEFGNHHRH